MDRAKTSLSEGSIGSDFLQLDVREAPPAPSLKLPQLNENAPARLIHGLRQAPDQDLGRTRKPGDRIEIAGIEQQDGRSEFIDGALGGAAGGNGAEIARQAPSRVEGHPMGRHRRSSQQGLESRQGRVHLYLVDHP